MPIETGNIDEVIDSLQWDYRDQYIMRAFPHALNPNIFLILSSISATETFVVSIMANDDGTLAYIDTLQLDASPVATAGGLEHVDGNVYCAAYLMRFGGNPTARIRTFTCDVNGNFGGLVDFFTFGAWGSASNALFRPDIVYIPGGTKYAVVATCGGDDGWLFTIDIDAAGNIAAAVTDQWEFDNFNGTFPRIFLRAGNVFVIYYARNNVFYMRSVSISALGVIGAQIDSAGGGAYQYGGEVVQLDGDLYVAVYSTAAAGWTEGVIQLFDIDAAGNIVQEQDRTIVFEYIQIPCAEVVGDNILGTKKILCIGTGAVPADGGVGLVTIEISDAGNIFPDFIDAEIMSTTINYRYPTIVNIHDQLYLIVTRSETLGGAQPGWAETRLINALVVSTQAPSDVESYQATFNGQLVYDELQACEVRFEYGKSPNFGYYTAWQSGFRMGDWFEATVDLAPGVTYQFRAQGRSVSGITNGATRTFDSVSIADSSPVAITEEATNVYTRQAELNGLVGFDGYEECTGWLEYGLSNEYGSETPVHRGLSTGDAFSESVTDLAPGQSYHVRAVLLDARGRKSYGQDKTFSTPSERGEMTGLDVTMVAVMGS